MFYPELEINKALFTKDVKRESTRQGFGDGLLVAGEENDGVVALTSDLRKSTKVDNFAKKFPKRFVQVGIAEQNMAGIAAGLALTNKIPFITSFASFSPGRNWEQIRVSIAFSNLNVKVVGSHSGLTASADGATAQALEDITITRVLPNMTVIHPIDYAEAKKATIAAAKHEGPVYLRVARERLPLITSEKTPFKIGKGIKFTEGNDVTLLTTGHITIEVLKAAKELISKHKIHPEVIACSTIKPLDEKTILDSVSKTKKVVTVEEHSIIGGFGSAVAELLIEKLPIPMIRIGIQDQFGESGTYEDLLEKHKLKASQIVTKMLKFL